MRTEDWVRAAAEIAGDPTGCRDVGRLGERIPGKNSQIRHMLLRKIEWVKGKNVHRLGQNVSHRLYSLSFVMECQFLGLEFQTNMSWLELVTWSSILTQQIGLAIKFIQVFLSDVMEKPEWVFGQPNVLISLTAPCESKDWQYLTKKVALLLVEDGWIWC